MPELPEVEVIRRGLASHLVGRTVVGVEVLHPRPVRSHPTGEAGFEADMRGRTFATPARRGKFLWLPFTDGDALLVQLRMSGQFRIQTPSGPEPIEASGSKDAGSEKHIRVRFRLDDGRELCYVDQRMLGGLSLSRGGAELPSEVAHIARDPFDPKFDLSATAANLRRRRSPVKAVLLNQQVISGIGNIYADEALWRARLHYSRPADNLGPRVATGLLRHARDVMTEALQAGGTSFDSLYVNVSGDSGYFARDLASYGRQGKPCLRCGTVIVREPFGGRSSYRCPTCQPAPRSTRTLNAVPLRFPATIDSL